MCGRFVHFDGVLWPQEQQTCLLRAILDAQDGKDVLRHLVPQPEIEGQLTQKSPLGRFHSSVDENQIRSHGKRRGAQACGDHLFSLIIHTSKRRAPMRSGAGMVKRHSR
jgi:hypothetical protein